MTNQEDKDKENKQEKKKVLEDEVKDPEEAFTPFKIPKQSEKKIGKGFQFEEKEPLIGPVYENYELRNFPIYTKRLRGIPPFGFKLGWEPNNGRAGCGYARNGHNNWENSSGRGYGNNRNYNGYSRGHDNGGYRNREGGASYGKAPRQQNYNNGNAGGNYEHAKRQEEETKRRNVRNFLRRDRYQMDGGQIGSDTAQSYASQGPGSDNAQSVQGPQRYGNRSQSVIGYRNYRNYNNGNARGNYEVESQNGKGNGRRMEETLEDGFIRPPSKHVIRQSPSLTGCEKFLESSTDQGTTKTAVSGVLIKESLEISKTENNTSILEEVKTDQLPASDANNEEKEKKEGELAASEANNEQKVRAAEEERRAREAEEERKKMTLIDYEKILEEKRNPLLALMTTEERKVQLDKGQPSSDTLQSNGNQGNGNRPQFGRAQSNRNQGFGNRDQSGQVSKP